MDGALSPNDRLDAAARSAADPAPTTVEGSDGALYVSGSGRVPAGWRGRQRTQRLCHLDGNAGDRVPPDGRLLVAAGRGLAAVDGAGRQSCQPGRRPAAQLPAGVVAGGGSSIFVNNAATGICRTIGAST